MSNLLSYRAGTLGDPSLPWGRIAETGVQGVEIAWSDGLTAPAASAALEPHGLRVTSLGVLCPLEDDGLPERMAGQAAVAADLGAEYMFYYYNHGIDTIDQLRRCISHVRGVHLKDTSGGYHDHDFPVFGEGVVDFAKVYEVLGQAGYESACCMELEGPVFGRGDPDDLAAKVARCVDHLKSVGVA